MLRTLERSALLYWSGILVVTMMIPSRSIRAMSTLFVFAALIVCVSSFGCHHVSRRAWISRAVATATAAGLPVAAPANAADDDCFVPCVKECSIIAPGAVNKPYCEQTCREYCDAKAAEGAPSGKSDVVRQDLS